MYITEKLWKLTQRLATLNIQKLKIELFVLDKLQERISREKGVSPEDSKTRVDRLNYYLGQRVTSRSELRRKGIKIPSAEEVWAAKEAGDEKAAYRVP